jgi:hypothetical protein
MGPSRSSLLVSTPADADLDLFDDDMTASIMTTESKSVVDYGHVEGAMCGNFTFGRFPSPSYSII